VHHETEVRSGKLAKNKAGSSKIRKMGTVFYLDFPLHRWYTETVVSMKNIRKLKNDADTKK